MQSSDCPPWSSDQSGPDRKSAKPAGQLHRSWDTIYVTSYTEGFSHFVTSMTAPVASGWSDLAGWDSHPLESAALSRRTRRPVIADHDGGRSDG